MATPTQPEKLVYLQNGVFKRKEMTEGIQYYSDNSFDTFAFPSTNGNYVLTKTDDVYTWSVAGEDFTSLDNSYFKGSDGQSITIPANGAIPFFKNNSAFGAINLPESGSFILTTDRDSGPSLEALTKPVIFEALELTSTSDWYAIPNWNSDKSDSKDLFLPSKPGTFFLSADSNNDFLFNKVTPRSLFHEALGIGSDGQRIVTYCDNAAYGLSLPTTAGYATFKVESSNESPILTNLTPQIVYKDILGCTSNEKCLVYNNGTNVSKLTIPSTAGKYVMEVKENGTVSLSPTSAKLSKTFEYTSWTSGHQVVSEALTSEGSDLSAPIKLEPNKTYMITIDAVLRCDNYEQALVGFTSVPTLVMGVETATIIKASLNNPVPTTTLSSTNIFTSVRPVDMKIQVIRSGDTTIEHYFTRLKVSIMEV